MVSDGQKFNCGQILSIDKHVGECKTLQMLHPSVPYTRLVLFGVRVRAWGDGAYLSMPWVNDKEGQHTGPRSLSGYQTLKPSVI